MTYLNLFLKIHLLKNKKKKRYKLLIEVIFLISLKNMGHQVMRSDEPDGPGPVSEDILLEGHLAKKIRQAKDHVR